MTEFFQSEQHQGRLTPFRLDSFGSGHEGLQASGPSVLLHLAAFLRLAVVGHLAFLGPLFFGGFPIVLALLFLLVILPLVLFGLGRLLLSVSGLLLLGSFLLLFVLPSCLGLWSASWVLFFLLLFLLCGLLFIFLLFAPFSAVER